MACLFSRQASTIRRRIRWRLTEFLKRFLGTEKPARAGENSSPRGTKRYTAFTGKTENAFPVRKSVSICCSRLSRSYALKVLRMAVRFYRLLKTAFVRNAQFLTSFLAARSQYFTAVCRFHSLTETMNRLTTATVWLECTFHISNICPFARECKGKANSLN